MLRLAMGRLCVGLGLAAARIVLERGYVARWFWAWGVVPGPAGRVGRRQGVRPGLAGGDEARLVGEHDGLRAR